MNRIDQIWSIFKYFFSSFFYYPTLFVCLCILGVMWCLMHFSSIHCIHILLSLSSVYLSYPNNRSIDWTPSWTRSMKKYSKLAFFSVQSEKNRDNHHQKRIESHNIKIKGRIWFEMKKNTIRPLWMIFDCLKWNIVLFCFVSLEKKKSICVKVFAHLFLLVLFTEYTYFFSKWKLTFTYTHRHSTKTSKTFNQSIRW